MSLSHVAAGRFVTGQSFPEVGPAAGRDGPGQASELGQPGLGGRDSSGEPDHIPAKLLGPGMSQNTFVLSSNRARVSSGTLVPYDIIYDLTLSFTVYDIICDII
jgi:hypothetical protein